MATNEQRHKASLDASQAIIKAATNEAESNLAAAMSIAASNYAIAAAIDRLTAKFAYINTVDDKGEQNA